MFRYRSFVSSPFAAQNHGGFIYVGHIVYAQPLTNLCKKRKDAKLMHRNYFAIHVIKFYVFIDTLSFCIKDYVQENKKNTCFLYDIDYDIFKNKMQLIFICL